MPLVQHAQRRHGGDPDQVAREAAEILEAKRGQREPGQHEKRSEQSETLLGERELAEVDDARGVEEQARHREHQEGTRGADIELRAAGTQEGALVAPEPEPGGEERHDREAVDL